MSTDNHLATLNIAAIQMVSTPDIQFNLETASGFISQAAKGGAQLAVLPEYFCLMGLKDTDKVRARERYRHGPIQERLCAIAKENNIYLIAGTIPLEASDPQKVLNTTLVFDPQGQNIGRYDKIHLFDFQTENERYQESETIEAGNVPGLLNINIDGQEWVLGLSICYDLRFPELYRALGQVDCHVIPAAFTYTTGKDHWEILLRARAIENQCYVLASAQGGTHLNQRRTWGHSMLIDPWGEVLADLPEGEGFISGVLCKDKLNDVRSTLPALAHRKL
ncbi:carbon-nitrogen hydrolase family protein [Polynucleobacter sp. AP-Melu-500A-A1]|uniref:carbon-nitrogen hydrolase family protein n=1 Tax=Polynucleobacter sp. AP-Melu-500A-A1 TaxID=2576929 RepID=UPI001C0C53C0|nr:carbon-nitrogen hydrolase family protein [Polynucleobacter sp. AP-Melu-500A-A1]MBU3631593.1 carbon-nitrogen hydrolase family protein [Polynucleobacter sp. AP-Melu-500A-A1]